MIYVLYGIIALLLVAIGYLCWKLYVFASIIMAYEQDLSDSISAVDNVEKSLDGIIALKMFFDSKDIQILIKDAMDSIKLAKLQIGKISKRFTDRSKHKYYLVEEVNEFEDRSFETRELLTPNEQKIYVE
jgi:hypothetical protein